MKIAVICGGMSRERDVSISTGTNVARALRKRGHRVALVDLFLGDVSALEDAEHLFTAEEADEPYFVAEKEPDLDSVRAKRSDGGLLGPGVIKVCQAADIAFLALHGAEGENGKLQACLDLYDIPYTGSGYLGSAIAMNKELTKILLNDAGIKTPFGVTLHRGEQLPGQIGFPCVVKPCSGGSSVATSIVQDPQQLPKALEDAFSCDDAVIVEQFVKGLELTVGVMEGVAMPVIEIIPKSGFYDYKNKYQPGLTKEICPARLSEYDTERVQRLAERVFKALKLDAYARVDFLMSDDDSELYCLEANSLPGMTNTSLIPQMAEAQGMSYGELCEKIIEVSLRKKKS